MRRALLVAILCGLAFPSRAAVTPEEEAARSLFERGAAAFESGRLDEARRKLSAAYRVAPTDSVRLLLARTLVGLSECKEALPLLRGVRLEALDGGARSDAEKALTAALDRCGGSAEEEAAAGLFLARGRERLDAKQYEAARRDLEIAKRIAPGDRVLLWLGYTYDAVGNCEEALRILESIDLDNLPADERAEAERRVKAGDEACSKAPLDMVYVPGGPFSMGSTQGEADERPVHDVTLDPYHIDRTEVTVARFEECVKAGSCAAGTFADHTSSPYCNYGERGRDDFPMNCVSWEAARAFCAWAGKRLPTEAEWEKAARSPDGRTYPWGEMPPTCELGVMKGPEGDGCDEDRTWVVGSRPRGVSELGLFDLAGNVAEWVADWYGEGAYGAGPSTNPRGPAEGSRRVVRGGAWFSDVSGRALRAANRDHDAPEATGNGLGFRCAK